MLMYDLASHCGGIFRCIIDAHMSSSSGVSTVEPERRIYIFNQFRWAECLSPEYYHSPPSKPPETNGEFH